MGAALGVLRLELQKAKRKRFNTRYPLVRRMDKARQELIAVASRLLERRRPFNLASLAEKNVLHEAIESLNNVAYIIEIFVRPR